MAKLDATGFETLASASDFFDTLIGSPGISTAYGRNGSKGMQGTAFNRQARKNLGKTVSTFIGAFAYKIQSIAAGTSNIMRLVDNGTVQAAMAYGEDGLVHCTGTAATWPIFTGTYMHIEVKCTISSTAGLWIVKVNGDEVFNVSGINTRAGTGNNYCTQFECLTQNTNNHEVYYDDMVLMDNTGSTFNDFIGDKRIVEQLPTGDGSVVTMTPSTGSTLYTTVDEATQNGDTDYIQSATPGERALFTFPALPVVTGQVLSADVLFTARKDDAGTRVLRGSAKSSGVNGNGADVSIGATYFRSRGEFLTDPNTGSAWTVAGVNAAEFGVEVVS